MVRGKLFYKYVIFPMRSVSTYNRPPKTLKRISIYGKSEHIYKPVFVVCISSIH